MYNTSRSIWSKSSKTTNPADQNRSDLYTTLGGVFRINVTKYVGSVESCRTVGRRATAVFYRSATVDAVARLGVRKTSEMPLGKRIIHGVHVSARKGSQLLNATRHFTMFLNLDITQHEVLLYPLPHRSAMLLAFSVKIKRL